MRLACIGGGPAGLYLALLMKQLDASHEIDVFERNRPDDTFGWGVVFSDQTLGNVLRHPREGGRLPASGPDLSPVGRTKRFG